MPDDVPHRTLGRTGLSVFPLGFGGAPVAFLKTEQDAAAKLMNDLLDAGLNLIDTAAAYPGSEQFIGEHLASRRDDYVLVSKCGNVKVEGTDAKQWTPELVTASIDRSLRLMKTDAVDVMLLHSCDLATLQKGEALGALVKAKQAGKVKHVGYSGDNEAVAAACAMPEIEVVETSINYVDQANLAALAIAKQHDVGVIVKRPIANAAWKGEVGREGIYVNYAKEYIRRHHIMRLDPNSLGFTDEQWPDVALRFTLSFPEVSVAIVGTTSPKNAMRNIDAAKQGPLPEPTATAIRTAFKSAPDSATWTGQT